MSKKELKKVHIDNQEYIYVVRESYDEITPVAVYESGNKSAVFCRLVFPRYNAITPSMVKEGILKHNADN